MGAGQDKLVVLCLMGEQSELRPHIQLYDRIRPLTARRHLNQLKKRRDVTDIYISHSTSDQLTLTAAFSLTDRELDT